MQIEINKDTFTGQFLSPISKIVGDDDANKGCVIDVTPKNITSLCNTKDGQIILFSNITMETGLADGEQVHLNVYDIRKFIKLLDCIPEDIVKLQINSNHLAYKSSQINFKFHLMDEGVIRKCIVNVDKIDKLTFDSEFIITKSKLDEIMKISSFTEDSNKLYLNCDGVGVKGELTDKTKPNIDTVNIQMAESFVGNKFNNLPISLDVLRKLSGIKFNDLNIKVNTQTKVLMMELSSNDCLLKYIATALVK
jgi:hypothetical protein